jgi:hypothetical protein
VTGPDVDRGARRVVVTGRTDLDGIDFIEVVANRGGTPGHVDGAPAQRTLLVYLLNGAVPPDWDRDRVSISGGVRPDPRINPVGVEWAYPALAVAGAAQDGMPPPPPGVSDADQQLVDQALPNARAVRERALVVRTTTSGDWSPYTLELTGDADLGGGRRLDEPLRQGSFSFTVDCPSDLDCAAAPAPAPPALPSTVPDYLARDADALLTRLTDRFAALLPGWTDRNPADPAVMLLELFAYLGDRLAYWQDAIAVEAYLGTARRRTSVRRHARLLDYRMHEGCSARVLLAVTTDTAAVLARSAPVGDTPALDGARPADADEAGAVVMETCAGLALRPARNAIALHSWGDPDHVLPAGTTSAWLAVPGSDPELAAGDLLVLADCPAGRPEDVRLGDPAARFAVRLDRDPVVHTDALAPGVQVLEVRWYAEDALPGTLRVSEPAADGLPAVRAVALANVVVADHGATVTGERLDPPAPPAEGAYRPRVDRTHVAFAEPFDPAATAGQPAAALLRGDPRQAVAQLSVADGTRTWQPQPDLVESGRLDAHLVVEPEADGVAWLRFGDGITGRAPDRQARHAVSYRVGVGGRGNVGADRLAYWLSRPDGSPAVASTATVWNPLPAAGGADPEPLDAVRELAPAVARTQLRAVTSADYAAAAQQSGGVQRAVARRRWTGSWYAQEVTLDPEAARAGDQAVQDAVTSLLETRRQAGVDVELAEPVYLALDLVLFACVGGGYQRAQVERQLLDALSARVLPGGSTGFFHPDRFTFGQPLVLSDLVAATMAVPGVTAVEVRRFAPVGAPRSETRANLAAGQIAVQPRQVVRCDSDPSNPEAGQLTITLGGGS